MYSKAFGFGGLVLLAAMIGCGSSGNGSGTGGTSGTGTGGAKGTGGGSGTGTFSTSVPSTTKLNGLSSSQATQLCNDFNSYATTLAPDLCKEIGLLGALFATGASNADLQAACTSAYNGCLTGDGGTTTMCDPTTVGANNGSATCTATVGDLTSCLNDTATSLNALPSCSTLTSAELAALAADGGSSPTSAACTAVNACKGVSTGSSTN